jgi:hypothetical protein
MGPWSKYYSLYECRGRNELPLSEKELNTKTTAFSSDLPHPKLEF